MKVSFEVGDRGDFIVELDEKVIFSKKALKDGERFPEVGEISKLIKEN